MTLPRFLCIGAQKAGTSWLFENLKDHPGLWLPPIKELHFFDHLFVEANRRWTLWHIQSSARRAIDWHVRNAPRMELDYIKYLTRLATEDVFTEKWYRSAFERPGAHGRICGDVTPEYSTVTEAGVQFVHGLLGAVKIIYIIREPVGRALSQLRMTADRRFGGSVDEATWLKLAAEPDIENRGAYSQYVPRWKKYFSNEDLLFIPYQKIGNDPIGVLRQIEAFLGIKGHTYKSSGRKIHATEPISIPEKVKSTLSETLAEEVRFIHREFGSEFASQV